MVRNQVFVGENKPRPSLVNPIQNRESSSKPSGGIWTSPMKDSGKSAFEEYEDGALIREGTDAWLLEPRKNVKVLEVKNVDELESLPERTDERFYIDETYIDFEEFFGLGYDGLEISADVSHRKAF